MMKSEKKVIGKHIFQRPMVAVASLAICLCLTGVTALAATGKLQGFFKDVTRWDGAVTGTAYEQATEEVSIDVAGVSDMLTVEITMLNPDKVPYSTLDNMSISQYKIVDVNGKEPIMGVATDAAEIVKGKVKVSIPIDGLESGEYKFVVSALIGSAKAEQPLVINGNWVCEFEK